MQDASEDTEVLHFFIQFYLVGAVVRMQKTPVTHDIRGVSIIKVTVALHVLETSTFKTFDLRMLIKEIEF
jgi:hypothetical protein